MEAPEERGRAGGAAQHGGSRSHGAPGRGRRVRALRPVSARVGSARRRRGVYGRGRRVRDASLHPHSQAARADARGGVRRQRPRRDLAHARPDRLDRTSGNPRPGRCPVSRRAAADARARRRRRARCAGDVGVLTDPAVDRAVRAGRVAGGGRACVRRRGRDRRKRLPVGLSRGARRREHTFAIPPPARRLPRRGRVPRPGDAVHRPRTARLTEPAARRRTGRAGPCART